MKRAIIFCILFYPLIFLFSEENEIDVNYYQNIINTLLFGLESIMGDDQSSPLVYETYSLSWSSIRNNEVTFKIHPKLNTVLSGMQFNVYESGEISLVFGLKFLDTFNKNSSIHYSILIHEYRHLHDYLKNKNNFTSVKSDMKESYWYELDALRIEAEFIKYYLYGKYKLSKFEEYILGSFEKDYLDSASITILKDSMNIFSYFNNLENQYYNNKDMKKTIINELINNGSLLLDKYNTQNSDFVNYSNYILLTTFKKYLIRLLPILMDNPTMTWSEVFSQYPEIENIYNSINVIQDANNEKYSQYIKSIYILWEEDIINRK